MLCGEFSHTVHPKDGSGGGEGCTTNRKGNKLIIRHHSASHSFIRARDRRQFQVHQTRYREPHFSLVCGVNERAFTGVVVDRWQEVVCVTVTVQ